MIRLMSALSECIPLGWASIQPLRRTATAATTHLFPRNQMVLPNSYSISLPSQPRLRGYSHLSCGFPRLSRYESTSRLFNFPPSSISGHTFSLQRRQLSLSVPPQNSIDSKMMGLSRLIHDPAKRKRLLLGMKLAGIALFLLVGKFISNEVRIERSLGPRPEDTDKIRDIKQFVVAFNQEKRRGVSRNEFLSFQDQAFAHIDELRYLGGLAARRPFNTDLLFAKRGFLELSTCEDPKVQREALRFLNMLLKRPFDPTQPAANFLWLEEDLGNMLRNMSEVNDSIPVMQELASAYGLVIEKIFLFCLDAGAQISNDQKLRVRKRANEISKKLENNPAFAYQAKNAEVIAKYLPTPSQPLSQTFKGIVEFIHPLNQASEAVSETIKGINELVEISKRQGLDITSFLNQELFAYEGWGKLRGFIEKSPELYEECEDALRRLENSWMDLKKDIPIYESVFLLRPCYMMSGKDEEVIEAIAESVRIVRQRPASDWVSLYRLVEMLAEVAMSSRSYDVRKTAYDEIIACITPDTPWPVLYKIAITLFSMKSDPLFKKSVEDVSSEAQALFQSTAEQRRGLRWFNNLNRQMEDIDQAILSRYSFQPDPHSKMAEQLRRWVFKAQAFIPRKDILEDLVSTFQEYRADTNQQVICGQGGVGKTTSATSYVKEFGRDYRFVYWIDAHTFEEDWDKLAKERGIDPDLARDQKQLLLRDYLEIEENEGWLLVIDQVNNKDLEKWGHLIPRKGGHVLMTARHLDEREWIDVHQTNLRCFSPLEAEYYILQSKRSIYRGDNEHVTTIVNRFGCLPLALAQTRAYLERNRGISLKSFLDLYDEERTRIFGSSGAKIGEGENESVHTTWAMNFKQLEEEHPKIAELFSFLSFLGSEEIPSCIIEKWREKNTSWGMLKGNQAIQTLLDYVLLDVKQEGVYSIHPLILQVSTDRLDEEQKRKCLQQSISVLRELTSNAFKIGKIQDFEVLRPHCAAIIEAAKAIDFKEMDFRCLLEIYYLTAVMGIYHTFIDENNLAENCFHYLQELSRTIEATDVYVVLDAVFPDWKSFLSQRGLDLGLIEDIRLQKHDQFKELFDLNVLYGIYKSLPNGLMCLLDGGVLQASIVTQPLISMEQRTEHDPRNLRLERQIIRDIGCMCRVMAASQLGFLYEIELKQDSMSYNDYLIQKKQNIDDQRNALLVRGREIISSNENSELVFRAMIFVYRLVKNEVKDDRIKINLFKLIFKSTQDDLLEMKICRDLAEIYVKLGKIPKAIEHQKQSLYICRRIYRSDAHPDVKRSLELLRRYQAMETPQTAE